MTTSTCGPLHWTNFCCLALPPMATVAILGQPSVRSQQVPGPLQAEVRELGQAAAPQWPGRGLRILQSNPPTKAHFICKSPRPRAVFAVDLTNSTRDGGNKPVIRRHRCRQELNIIKECVGSARAGAARLPQTFRKCCFKTISDFGAQRWEALTTSLKSMSAL